MEFNVSFHPSDVKRSAKRAPGGSKIVFTAVMDAEGGRNWGDKND